MLGCAVGALLAVLVNVVAPWWIGFKGWSPLWLLLLAVFVFPTLGKNVTTYNLVRSSFRSGSDPGGGVWSCFADNSMRHR